MSKFKKQQHVFPVRVNIKESILEFSMAKERNAVRSVHLPMYSMAALRNFRIEALVSRVSTIYLGSDSITSDQLHHLEGKKVVLIKGIEASDKRIDAFKERLIEAGIKFEIMRLERYLKLFGVLLEASGVFNGVCDSKYSRSTVSNKKWSELVNLNSKLIRAVSALDLKAV